MPSSDQCMMDLCSLLIEATYHDSMHYNFKIQYSMQWPQQTVPHAQPMLQISVVWDINNCKQVAFTFVDIYTEVSSYVKLHSMKLWSWWFFFGNRQSQKLVNKHSNINIIERAFKFPNLYFGNSFCGVNAHHKCSCYIIIMVPPLWESIH